ncbi:TauD/TfdA family dioxygenase [Streptomyces sp. CB00316]|uniref:TauD/TfdA family dioxygenase n=1 Tax=Streptomyces sp. CB00316 TaxID=1703932 RepID=UPI00093C061F
MLLGIDSHNLESAGFCVLRDVDVARFIEIAGAMGRPTPTRRNGPVLDVLTPKREQDARPSTISSHYGLGQFPWHSDGAVDKDPPRYILMRADTVAADSATTDILDLRSLGEGKTLKKYSRLSLLVNARNFSYLAPFVMRRNGVICAKWDPLRTTPTGKIAEEFLSDVPAAPPTAVHHWHPGDVLIIDNWRCLHRRSAATVGQRVIHRIVVKVERSNYVA